jgi:predicted nucleotidyltransferase
MHRDHAIAILRAHEPELRAAGVEHLSIFGSVAREEAKSSSDVDVLVRLTPEANRGGFAYFGRLDDLTRRLEEILGCSVDVIAEPVRKERLRENIEREATLAF